MHSSSLTCLLTRGQAAREEVGRQENTAQRLFLYLLSGIPRADLRKWREDPDLRPQQLNSLDVHPLLKDLLKQDDENSFATDEPSRPVFSDSDKDHEADEILFDTEDQEDINDFIAVASIGLEWNVEYNAELPSQLSPELYYNLNWALDEDRQELLCGE